MKTYVVNADKGRSYHVYIGRNGGGRWGNPFSVGPSCTRDQACDQHEKWVRAQPELVAAIKRELKGKILGCHCKPLRCHGDTLAKIAEEP